MKHFISNGVVERNVILDVSFLTDMLYRIEKNAPTEVKLIEFYNLRSLKETNTNKLFMDYLMSRHKVTTLNELYGVLKHSIITKTVFRIKAALDAMIFREYGCEVSDASFVKFITLSKECIKIEIRIS